MIKQFWKKKVDYRCKNAFLSNCEFIKIITNNSVSKWNKIIEVTVKPI